MLYKLFSYISNITNVLGLYFTICLQSSEPIEPPPPVTRMHLFSINSPIFWLSKTIGSLPKISSISVATDSYFPFVGQTICKARTSASQKRKPIPVCRRLNCQKTIYLDRPALSALPNGTLRTAHTARTRSPLCALGRFYLIYLRAGAVCHIISQFFHIYHRLT